MTTYTVAIGGSPNFHEFDNLDDAKEACLELAQYLAEERGLDPDDVDLFENGWGDEIEIGACPAGDDGAYWPHVEKRS